MFIARSIRWKSDGVREGRAWKYCGLDILDGQLVFGQSRGSGGQIEWSSAGRHDRLAGF